EPIRPKRSEADPDVDYLLPRLQEFYEKAIAAVRKIDTKHLFTLEGHHWASTTNIFHKKYDEKMVIHFHRYGCQPDIACYQEFIELSRKLDCPLWLGETGENVPEWFTAMYPLAAELSIGYNLWSYKKMDAVNCPCSIKKPKDWELLLNYAKKGKRPGYRKAQEILEEYLENMKLANCELHPEVTKAVFRQPGSIIRGTDFDQFPGKGISCSGIFPEENIYGYRMGMGMEIKNKFPDHKQAFGFDCGWKRFVLVLSGNEFACYSLFGSKPDSSLWIHLYVEEDAEIIVSAGEKVLENCRLTAGREQQEIGPLSIGGGERNVIRIEAVSGRVEIEEIVTA
ncbi:MAG: glycoside hydrolase, partial [Lachnospiraceae bacterium]|nr:glycoside hydrolase [Lachnospiraceae bacterium]